MTLLKVEDLIDNQEHQIRVSKFQKFSHPSKIPICLHGGVGDVIMAIPLVKRLNELGNVEVYTKHAETFDYFKPDSLPQAIPQVAPDYTWYLQVNTVVRFKFNDGFLSLPDPIRWLYLTQIDLFDKYPGLESMIRHHPLQDAAVARLGKKLKLHRRDFPFFSIGLAAPLEEPKPSRSIEPYITIHDGYELSSSHVVKDVSTKQWDLESWRLLLKVIKTKYPDYKIIQLGSSTARPIEGVDENKIHQTTLLEAFDIIKGSTLHIDGDSGLVHAATEMGVPCVVMFGPTPDYFFGYKENINIRADTCKDACYWLKTDWLGQCPIDYLSGNAQCMNDISLSRVFEAVDSILSK